MQPSEDSVDYGYEIECDQYADARAYAALKRFGSKDHPAVASLYRDRRDTRRQYRSLCSNLSLHHVGASQ